MQMQPDVSWGWNVQDSCIHVAGILAERAARLGPPYSMFPLPLKPLFHVLKATSHLEALPR